MKKKYGWISWVSLRFLTGRRKGRGRLLFLFSVILICVGVTTLNTILAIMNGLQQGYIRNILEIGSYHVRWSPKDRNTSLQSMQSTISIFETDSGVLTVTPFREGQTLLNGNRFQPAGALIRGLPPDVYQKDALLANYLDLGEDSFDLSGDNVILGKELAINLGVSPGDQITVLDLSESGFSSSEIILDVSGVFECGYRQYESSLAFVSLETASLFLADTPIEIGIKLNRAGSDRSFIQRLSSVPESAQGTFMSWRESNKVFFGALRTEKTMMLLLLTLIFVVVAVNIDHSLRRMATERVEDLSILKTLGASPGNIRILFLRHGFMIGGMGGVSGTVLGVLVGGNVDAILNFVRSIRGKFSWLGLASGPSLENFFQSSEIIIHDVLTIFFLAMLISSLAAVRAASAAARSNPIEVLRSE